MTRHRQQAHPATDAPPRRRRGERGLTTLEWLLIVAAVAGLAALAVVLVQNVVDETAEQISGSSARLTAALVAAQEITDDCRNTDHADKCDADTDQAVMDAKARCERLLITYGDALRNSDIEEKTVKWYNAPGSGVQFDGDDLSPQPTAWSCRIIDSA